MHLPPTICAHVGETLTSAQNINDDAGEFEFESVDSERWLQTFENDIKNEMGSDVFHAIQEDLSERRWREGSYFEQ